MAEKKTRIVKVTYKTRNRLEGEFIAGYLRFIGIFVSQRTGRYRQTISEGEFDACIECEELETLNRQIEKSSEEENECILLKEVNKIISNDPKERIILDKLVDIYVQEKLLIMSYITHNYMDEIDMLRKTCDNYINAYREIRDLKSENNAVNDYVQYAKYYCAEKINKIYGRVLGEFDLEFQTKGLLEEMDALINEYDDFYNIYVLQGLLCNIDIVYRNRTPAYFEKAIEQMESKNVEVLSFVYYREGLFFQRIQKNEKYAHSFFKKAEASVDNNYRALYKVAIYKEKVEKQYKTAEEMFERVLRNIEKLNQDEENEDNVRYENFNLEELLYYYKTYREIGIINVRFLEKYEEGKKNFEKADQIFVRIKQGTYFIKKLFGNEGCKKYCDAMTRKINIYQNKNDINELERIISLMKK